MKKFFSLITLMLCMVFGSVAFVACGSDDDDTGGGGDPTVTESQILGMWYGVTESNHDLEVFIFNIQANGNGRYLENAAKASKNWIPSTYDLKMTWALSNGTFTAVVDAPDGKHTMKGDILKLSSTTLKIKRHFDDGTTDIVEMKRINNTGEALSVFNTKLKDKTGQGGETPSNPSDPNTSDTPDPTITAAQLEGVWYSLKNTSEKLSVSVIDFKASDGTCIFGEYWARAENNWNADSKLTNATWTLSNGIITITVGTENMRADLLQLSGDVLKIKAYKENNITEIMEYKHADSVEAVATLFNNKLNEKKGN
jgi:hypothetical protein